MISVTPAQPTPGVTGWAQRKWFEILVVASIWGAAGWIVWAIGELQ